MKKEQFLELMKFPTEWHELSMYPDELFKWQLSGYRPGHEDGGSNPVRIYSPTCCVSRPLILILLLG